MEVESSMEGELVGFGCQLRGGEKSSQRGLKWPVCETQEFGLQKLILGESDEFTQPGDNSRGLHDS